MMNEFGQALKDLFAIKRIVDIANHEIDSYMLETAKYFSKYPEGPVQDKDMNDFLKFALTREKIVSKLIVTFQAIEDVVEKREK